MNEAQRCVARYLRTHKSVKREGNTNPVLSETVVDSKFKETFHSILERKIGFENKNRLASIDFE